MLSLKPKAYEKSAIDHGSPFTWCQGESLDQLEQPKRVREIQDDHKRRIKRLRAKIQPNPLRTEFEPLDVDDLLRSSESVSCVS